jgi:hypothetical protein
MVIVYNHYRVLTPFVSRPKPRAAGRAFHQLSETPAQLR